MGINFFVHETIYLSFVGCILHTGNQYGAEFWWARPLTQQTNGNPVEADLLELGPNSI
jgi:hypothetical protein